MDKESFNYLLKTCNVDENSKVELYKYILANIKRRLYSNYYNVSDKEDVAHEILKQFIKCLPKKVAAPFSYVNTTVDNFMKSNHEKYKEVAPLEVEPSYEQHFEKLDKMEVFKLLKKHLKERAALIVYWYVIEDVSEKEIAEKTGLNYENVRAIYSRAIKKLKKIYPNVTEFNLDLS